MSAPCWGVFFYPWLASLRVRLASKSLSSCIINMKRNWKFWAFQKFYWEDGSKPVNSNLPNMFDFQMCSPTVFHLAIAMTSATPSQAPEWFDPEPHYCDPMHNDKSVAWPTGDMRFHLVISVGYFGKSFGICLGPGFFQLLGTAFEKIWTYSKGDCHICCHVWFGRVPSRPGLHPLLVPLRAK